MRAQEAVGGSPANPSTNLLPIPYGIPQLWFKHFSAMGAFVFSLSTSGLILGLTLARDPGGVAVSVNG
jgi:hypothetical protein